MKKIAPFLIVVGTIAVLYGFFEFVLKSDIEQLAQLQNKYTLQKTVLKFAQENHKNLTEQLQVFAIKPSEIQSRKDLKNLIAKFLPGAQLSFISIAQKGNDGVKIERFLVQSTIESPKEFYRFVDFVAKRNYPIMVDYPITFRKNATKIELSFFIEIYQD